MKAGWGILAVAALLALGGCATWSGADPESGLSSNERYCLQFYSALDRRIDVAGVRDGTDHRLPGFPYLRADRFTASFAPQIKALAGHGALIGDSAADRASYEGAEAAQVTDGAAAGRGSAGAARNAWIDRMALLDRQSRHYEIENLPGTGWPVAGYPDVAALNDQVNYCSRLLVQTHASDPRRTAALIRASEVPDDYSGIKRALGLYPITGIGIASGVRRWEAQSQATFLAQRLRPTGPRAVYQRYGPTVADPASARPSDKGRHKGSDKADAERAGADAIAASRQVLQRSPVDALGVPLLDEAAVLALARAYAPTFEIATSAEHDRFGPLQWIDLGGLVGPRADPFWLDVDPSQPVVYYELGFTRYGPATLPQIIYSIWFPERMAADGSDWEAGRLDGLIWRVTLDPVGNPLLFEAVHPSGCCHQFFNTARLMPKAAPADKQVGEWAFAPLGMPIESWVAGRGMGEPASAGADRELAPEVGPLALRLASHNHQLIGIGPIDAAWGEPLVPNPPYRLESAQVLRALPRPGSSSRSIYDADGQIVGSERFLRFALWPAGIDNAGAQRQVSRLPTAFVGRHHFDDADLIEQRFRVRP